MVESSLEGERRSKNSAERLCKFGTIVLALWPENPTGNLAQRIKSTKRAADFYINGERKVTARCVQAIVNEMLE